VCGPRGGRLVELIDVGYTATRCERTMGGARARRWTAKAHDTSRVETEMRCRISGIAVTLALNEVIQ